MKKHISALLALFTALGPNLAVASQIQQQGIKTLAQCIAGGATGATCLPLAAQVWDSTNGQQLSLSIANGQLGGGGGSKNYLSSYIASTGGGTANTGNGDFELDATTGWSLAHSSLTSLFPTSLASATVPFDSTHGGSAASSNLTFTINSSTPLQKKYSGSLASSAASVAGDMLISKAFNIDTSDQSAPMTITLATDVTVGASTLNFSGTSSNSFAIYVYDVTAAAWIQPAGVYGMVSNGVYNVKNVVFQPQSSTSTQYQLAFINVNASSGAYTMLLDAIGVGPQAALSAPAMNDWASYTPTFTNLPGTSQGFFRRIGDSVEVQVYQTASGAATGTISASIPSGLSIDTTKQVVNGALGSAEANAGGAITAGVVQPFNSTSVDFVGAVSGTGGAWNATNPFTWAASNLLSAHFIVPIIGWSSNTASSADTDTRVVSARYHNLNGVTSIPDQTAFKFTTKDWDTHGAYNTSTGGFTAPVTGFYKVTADYYAGSSGTFAYVAKNGLSVTPGNPGSQARLNVSSAPSQAGVPASTLVQANAGDVLYVAGASGITINSDSTEYSYVEFERVTGPSVIQATETVSARYYSSSTSLSGSLATIVYATKDFDDHAMCSSSVCTLPISGKYLVCIGLTTNGTIALNSLLDIQIQKNTVAVSESKIFAGGAMTDLNNAFCDNVRGVAGDSIQIQASSSATLPGITASNTQNYLSIVRTGN